MARVDYVALDGSGREVKGGLDAPDLAGAASALRGQGLFPLELTPGRAVAAPTAGLDRRLLELPVRAAQRALFMNQLGLMLRTGLTLLQALDALATVATSSTLRRVARRLAAAVSGGRTLSSAMEDEPALGGPVVVQLVRMAEATGELDQALVRSAEWVERRAALRSQVLTSLAYPVLVLLVASGVFWFLTTSLIPKIARFLTSRGGVLPWSTQRLMDLSAFMVAWGPYLAGAVAVTCLALYVARRTRAGLAFTDDAVLWVPVVGLVLRTAAMGHAARTLSLLLGSGLPLVESLRILAASFESTTYARVLVRSRERITQGNTLAASLEDRNVTPLFLQVVAVGERTGALDEVLGELSTFYDQRLQALLRTLAAMVEPVTLVVVGGMVGFVYFSFFQAIFSLTAR